MSTTCLFTAVVLRSVMKRDADIRESLYTIVVLSGGTNISFQSVMKRGAVHLVRWLCFIRELPGLVWSLGPKSSPGALHHWFVCSECMPQSPASVVGLFPDATCSSPHDHFDGIRVVS